MLKQNTIWICYEPARALTAIGFATRLRRNGVAVEMAYGGKLKNQTKKARADNPLALITLFCDGRNSIKRRWDERGQDLTLDDIFEYLIWQAEDDLQVKDPLRVLTLLGDDPILA